MTRTHAEWGKYWGDTTVVFNRNPKNTYADWTEERDKLIEALKATVDGIEAIESDRAWYSQKEMDAQIELDKALLNPLDIT